MSEKNPADKHRSGRLPLPPMDLTRWGTDAEAKELSESIRTLLREVLGVTAETGRTFDPAAVTASPSRLTDADLAALADIVGPGDVSVDDAQRLARARGKSTPDLLAWRTRPAVDCSDAVVAPGDDDEVAALLDWCTSEKIAVVPFGGGTSVVGGLSPATGAAGGLDSGVNRRANEMGLLRGPLRYVLASIIEFPTYRPRRFRMVFDAGLPSEDTVETEVLLSVFAIARSYGGDMNIAPDADRGDGLFDVCYVGRSPDSSSCGTSRRYTPAATWACAACRRGGAGRPDSRPRTSRPSPTGTPSRPFR